MPIERKLIFVGDSRCVSLPALWLDIHEKRENKKIVAISMEVGNTITLQPIFEKESKLHSEPAKQKLSK